MPLNVYLDEAGDHSLQVIDQAFPVFALVFLICDREYYVQTISPEVNRLKLDYFNHEAVVLHSRDIRKAQGDFGIFTDQVKKRAFADRLTDLMARLDYTIIGCVIKKQALIAQYTYPDNPYDLALTFALERLLPMLEEAGQTEVQIIAEARGRREDEQLNLSFLNTVNNGTRFIDAERFRRIRFKIEFVPKSRNIIGTQLADLAAYPIARYYLNPTRANPAYDVVAGKLYRGRWSSYGLKIFP